MPTLRPALRSVAALLVALVLTALAPAVAHGQSGTSDLTVENTGPAITAAGTDISYDITVANTGPDASDPVTLTDTLPADTTFVSLTQNSGPAASCSTPAAGANGTVSCTNVTLPAGATAAFTLVVHSDPAIVPGGYVTNVAQVSTAGFDPAEENDSSSSSALITGGTSADVGVSVDATDKAAPDRDLAYDITIGNDGPDAADVSLADSLPGDLTFVSLEQRSGPALSCTTPAVGAGGTVSCSTASLAAGSTATLRLTAHVPPGAPSGTEYLNTVSVSTTATDPSTDDDSAATATTISAADLEVSIGAPAAVKGGQTVSYALTFANNGPDTAVQPVMYAQVPADTTIVSFTQSAGSPFSLQTPAVGGTGSVAASRSSMGVGETATFTLVLELSPGAPDSVLENVATTDQTTADPDVDSDSDTATTTVTALQADRALGLAASNAVSPGQELSYTITFGNAGPDAAEDATLSDALPPNTTFVSLAQNAGQAFDLTAPAVGETGTVTASRSSWAAGGTATFTLVVRVGASARGSVTNTVTSSAQTRDGDARNDTSTATTSVTEASPPAPPAPAAQCRSTRRVSVTLSRRHKLAPRRIQVLVNGRLVRRYGPRLKVSVSLVGRPAGRYRVDVYARYRDGRLVRRGSTITTCVR